VGELPADWQKVNEQGRCRCGCPLHAGCHMNSGDLLHCAQLGWESYDRAVDHGNVFEAEVERLTEALRLAEHEALGSDALLNHAVPVIVAARRYIAKGNNGTTEPCGPHCAGCEGHGICGIEQLAVSVMEYDSLFRTAHEAREGEAQGE